MQSTYRKVVRGASVHKTVLLYVTNKDEQLVDKARQLGVEAVALPSAKKLIACTEEFWLVVSRFEVFLWTKEAASLLRRAPAVSRRMLSQGRRVARVDYEEADLLEDLVAEKTWGVCKHTIVKGDTNSAGCTCQTALLSMRATSSGKTAYSTAATDSDWW